MDEQDQTWTQWKSSGRRLENNGSHVSKMKRYPLKPDLVIEFERMDEVKKSKFRGSEEWPEVKSYYDEIQEVRHNNSAASAYLMQMGSIVFGSIDYGNGMFIYPVRHPIAEETRWQKGPEGIYHKPGCSYRNGGYKDKIACDCYRLRPRALFSSRKSRNEKSL